jgi:2-dehydro-3-deoxygluconokinase
MSHYDVVTLGETMMRLNPPGHLRIEQTNVFEIEIGGTESNMAVSMVRLGLKVAWLSRLPANALGKRLTRILAGNDVDVSHVVWAEGERLGTFFIEFGEGSRPTTVIYDRADSAMARMRPEELPEDLFQPGQARHLHLTGITLAISDTAAATARRALDLAKAAGWTTSFDVNYRAKLWTPEVCRQGCQSFAEEADLFFIPLRDAQTIYGVPEAATPLEALAFFQERFPHATIVLTLGASGAIAAEPGKDPIQQPSFPVTGTVGRIGAGDSFIAGVLYRYLEPESRETWLSEALRWGTAAAAFKYTIPGDMGLFEREEIEALVNSAGSVAPQVQR